jgi:hypothetical protein
VLVGRAHERPAAGNSGEQKASAGNWQKVVSSVFTQLCPAKQSSDVWQAS